MTVNEILQDAYRRLNFSETPDARVQARLLSFADDTHRELLTMPGMDQLRDDRSFFTTAIGVYRIGLPQAIGRIQAIVDQTNQIVLKELTLAEIRRRNPGQNVSGLPTVFARIGEMGVFGQPRDLDQIHIGFTTLYVYSLDASDTTQTVTVQGLTTESVYDTKTVTLNGTSPVAITMPSGFDVNEVTKWYISATAVGAVYLYHGNPLASGVRLGVIYPGQTFARYHGIHLDPHPSASSFYYIDFTREIPTLTASNDEPLLPTDFHRLISLGIRKREYEKMNDPRYQAVSSEYEEGKRALRSWVQSDGTGTLSLRRRGDLRPSQLGAYYPAGS